MPEKITETRTDTRVALSIPMPFGQFIAEDLSDAALHRAMMMRRRLGLDELAAETGSVIVDVGTNGQRLYLVFEFGNHVSAMMFADQLIDARPDWCTWPPKKADEEPVAL